MAGLILQHHADLDPGGFYAGIPFVYPHSVILFNG